MARLVMKSCLIVSIFALMLYPAISFAEPEKLLNLGAIVDDLNFIDGDVSEPPRSGSASFSNEFPRNEFDEIECKVVTLNRTQREFVFCESNGVYFVKPNTRQALPAK